ncbi:UNVERIFIED_CONTAM: Scarecrow-like protein 14 [Sesamum calycinum]|uniref:Scarecrow-like protein 14 n=1 Tax=Sesamum calycinum TaxID=2727403 RepID=A0AAW2RPB4_9LAMI
MDQNYRDLCGPTSGIILNKQAIPLFPGQNLINNVRVSNKFLTGSHADVITVSSHLNFDAQAQSAEGDAPEDLDFSDVVLKYINHILMEEDVEEKACMFQESAALQAAERSFYEVIGEKYPASADYQHVAKLDHSFENPDCCGSGDMETLCPDWNSDRNCRYGHYDTVDVVSTSQSSYSSSSSSGTIIEFPIDSPVSTLRIPDIFTDGQSAIQFKKGAEEASKFLPNGSNLIVDLGYDELSGKEQNEGSASLVVKVEKKTANEEFVDGSRGKKNPYQESMSLHDQRSNKQSAVYTESTVSPDMFDKVLLCSGGKNESDLRKALNEVTKSTPQNDQPKGSNGGKSGAKKKGGKRNVVDMRTLLTLCAQAVAADDRRTANEFLKQIRQHATPTGDGMQRLAHYFADGLEARMAGSGTQIYTSLINMPTSAADILKAYHIYLATCPFRKISNFFSNKTIMNVAEKVTKLHIIDFGILYGFQWPCFLQRLSSRPGGPPKLRFTGIDLPCPGFRPSERVEETGGAWLVTLRLLKFHSNSIAEEDESAVFVLGVVNGAYNAPFFITRFREALFHYSSFFDMLDANIPREIHERMLLERTVFGREAMNVIACEAAERIERPETYKQWQGGRAELYMHFLLGGQLIEGHSLWHEERPDHQLLAMLASASLVEYELLLR